MTNNKITLAPCPVCKRKPRIAMAATLYFITNDKAHHNCVCNKFKRCSSTRKGVAASWNQYVADVFSYYEEMKKERKQTVCESIYSTFTKTD